MLLLFALFLLIKLHITLNDADKDAKRQHSNFDAKQRTVLQILSSKSKYSKMNAKKKKKHQQQQTSCILRCSRLFYMMRQLIKVRSFYLNLFLFCSCPSHLRIVSYESVCVWVCLCRCLYFANKWCDRNVLDAKRLCFCSSLFSTSFIGAECNKTAFYVRQRKIAYFTIEKYKWVNKWTRERGRKKENWVAFPMQKWNGEIFRGLT